MFHTSHELELLAILVRISQNLKLNGKFEFGTTGARHPQSPVSMAWRMVYKPKSWPLFFACRSSFPFFLLSNAKELEKFGKQRFEVHLDL